MFVIKGVEFTFTNELKKLCKNVKISIDFLLLLCYNNICLGGIVQLGAQIIQLASLRESCVGGRLAKLTSAMLQK